MRPSSSTVSQRFCPYDGHLLGADKFCEKCQIKINIQVRGPRKPRNFYEKMPEGIEDNYVDELFLKGMAHKNSFPDLHYPVMIKNTVEIVHVINSVFFQICLFYVLVNSSDDSKIENVLFVITIALSLVGYIVYTYFRIEANYHQEDGSHFSLTVYHQIFGWEFLNNIKSILFLSMILSLITPVLGSLTVTYSDDTIILDFAITVFVHLLYYDYEQINSKPDLRMPPVTGAVGGAAIGAQAAWNAKLNEKTLAWSQKQDARKSQQQASDQRVVFGTPTSINAIFFGSILLSSRLNRTSKVFTLLYISLCIFGFIPIFRHLIKHKYTFVYYTWALLMSLCLIYVIFKVNPLFGFLYFSLIVFISFLSPLIFIYAYQFKNDIRGPWDCPQIKQYHSL